MSRPRTGAIETGPQENYVAGLAEQETLAANTDADVTDKFDSVLDEDSDFDVEEDIAFKGEEYDVLDIDDVLDMCNFEKREFLDS